MKLRRPFRTFRYGVLVLSAGCASSPAARLPAASPPADLNPAVAEYVRTAVQMLQRESRHRDTVNWQILTDSALLLSRGATELRDAYPVIQWMLGRVDHHSFLQAPRRGAGGTMLRGRVAYLRVPFAPGPSQAVADSLQLAISRFQDGACGWLVDLRFNGGGNVWPMLAGVGPLLGDSTRIWFQERGTLRPYGLYVAGASLLLADTGAPQPAARATVAPARPVAPGVPVAVAIDEGTGSSGEAILIAFKARANTRIFGTPSAGSSTSNSGFRLPDGANMVITTAIFADAVGRVYGGPVQPDEVIRSPLEGANLLEGDPVTRRALDWLMQQPGCTFTR